MDERTIIGFLDETSPQTTANTQRLWSFNKPEVYKNTTKMRANAFGFYALNGRSVMDFKEHSKKEDICEFLRTIREGNPGRRIVVVLDNFSSHRAKDTIICAEECGIELVFLPPYSPDLNPIEFIWKSIKRVVSRTFIVDLDHLKSLIEEHFMRYSSKLSFAAGWIEKFIKEDNKCVLFGS